jgi:hypothetical protein
VDFVRRLYSLTKIDDLILECKTKHPGQKVEALPHDLRDLSSELEHISVLWRSLKLDAFARERGSDVYDYMLAKRAAAVVSEERVTNEWGEMLEDQAAVQSEDSESEEKPIYLRLA